MRAIVAADAGWGIGLRGRLLVSIPADMKMFRQKTTGKVVVMGRKTLESFPGKQPLKNRTNIVLTSHPDYTVRGAVIVHGIEELKQCLAGFDPDDVYCIGGDSIYRQLLPMCDLAYVTRIDYTYEADSHFPDLDRAPEWEMTARSEEQTYFDLTYYFTTYRRKTGG